MLDTSLDWGTIRMRPTVRSVEVEALDVPRDERVYLATPISAYLARGEADLCVQLASEWQAWLLSEGLSPICPALLTVQPLYSRHDDHVGLMLRGMDHRWWMQRCIPWMRVCRWCLVPPIAGWMESRGVLEEADWFSRQAHQVRLLRGRA